MTGSSAWLGWVVVLIIVLGAFRGTRLSFRVPAKNAGSTNPKKVRRERFSAIASRVIVVGLVGAIVFNIFRGAGWI